MNEDNLKAADQETDAVCLLCARWHPGIKYSHLLDAWIGRNCLLGILDANPHDDVAHMVADELNVGFSDESSVEMICDFCGENDAVVIDEVYGSKFCESCLNKIKS